LNSQKLNTNTFQENYLALRKLEGRVYSNEKVAQLPKLKRFDKHYKEWKVRGKSAERFIKYLKEDHSQSALLEIGCGNGWFSNKCAEVIKFVVGTDVNSEELNQAISVFEKTNLTFIETNIFDEKDFYNTFDLIVFNASIQYFENFDQLISTIRKFLKPSGEIHIIDSPFYDENQLEAAKKRSEEYFEKMGFSEMSCYYFHHKKSDLANFEALYSPNQSKIEKLLKGKDSPFSWYKIEF
jgi:SAM-dependent methyltransferase